MSVIEIGIDLSHFRGDIVILDKQDKHASLLVLTSSTARQTFGLSIYPCSFNVALTA